MNLAYLMSFTASFLQAVFIPTLVIYAYKVSLTELQISLIAGLSNLVYIVGAFLSAKLYTSLGPRKTIFLAFALLASGLVAHILSTTFPGILTAASVVLLGFGLFWPAVETHLSNSGASVSIFSFSWSSGSLVGALLTSTLLRFDLRLLFIVYGVIAFLHGLASTRIRGGATQKKVSNHYDNSVKSLLLLVTPWLYCLAYASSASGVFTFYPLFVESRNLSKDLISLVNFTMLLSRTLTFFFYEHLPPSGRNLLLSSILFLGGGALTLTTNGVFLILFSALVGYSQGIVYATGLEQVFKRGQGTEKATALFESFIGLGYAVAPPVSAMANTLLGFEPISFSSLLSLIYTLSGMMIVRTKLTHKL